jgi:biotin transport system permease protein/energy-coupling factor transport system permease protein
MDPRSKIAAAAALGVVTLKGGPYVLALASLGVAAMVVSARLSFRRLYGASKPALPFICIIFLLHLLFTEGSPLLNIALGPLKVTAVGFTEGGLLAWRFALLLQAGALLTMTTPLPELTSGIERLLRPIRVKGISSQDLALMVSLALRFLPTLQEEMESLKEAQLARGADFAAKGLRGRVRALSGLALPLSLAVFRRCDHLVEAMYARGYDGGPRTGLKGDLTLSAGDRIVIILSVAAGIACFVL